MVLTAGMRTGSRPPGQMEYEESDRGRRVKHSPSHGQEQLEFEDQMDRMVIHCWGQGREKNAQFNCSTAVVKAKGGS